MTTFTPSQRLFVPNGPALHAAAGESPIPIACAGSIEKEIRHLVEAPNYPCVAAIAAVKQRDYLVGLYEKFGAAHCWKDLRADLLFFLERQKTVKAPFLSFFAVFQPGDFTEEEFENALWRELSSLTSEEERNVDWPAGAPKDPADKAFLFSVGGASFFVVGLHSNSSRSSRKFRYPTLIFNVFEQFTELQKANKYEAMVRTNRARDVKFEGSTNPMALKHAEQWETIQFSGRNNGDDWRCPFRFLKSSEKYGSETSAGAPLDPIAEGA